MSVEEPEQLTLPVDTPDPVVGPEPEVTPVTQVPVLTSGPVIDADYPVDEAPLTPDPQPSEMERIEPLPTGPVVLESGSQLEVVPMGLRETMKLLKIITHGAGPVLASQFAALDFNDGDAFAQTLLAIIIMSVGDAEDELIEFLQAMCRPVGWKGLSGAKEQTAALTAMYTELHNPSLDDAVSILTRIVAAEAENLRALGKRIAALAPALRASIEAKAA